jgi:SAM-dependent methyltransferase
MRGKDAGDAGTLDFYSRLGEGYTSAAPAGPCQFLSGFLERLKPRSRILELGCGSGRDSEAMIAAGHDVDPTDGSPEIAAEAARRLQRPVRVLRFDELAAVEAFDAVWANACLLHVPREVLPEVLRRVYGALKPGGWHFASYKSGGAEGRDRFGRYFNYLSSADATRAYEVSAQWTSLSIIEYQGGSYDGGRLPWIAVVAQRPA